MLLLLRRGRLLGSDIRKTQRAAAELAIARFATREAIGRNGFSLSSPAFPQGGELDPCFTADEEDAVAPPMEWTAPPKGAEEVVLIVEDASTADPPCHWLVWGLPAQHGKLLEGEGPPTVGIRCPDHDLVRAIAAEVGPIATSSANRSGESTPADAVAAAQALGGGLLAVDGGPCTGVPSTVLDLTVEPARILRLGSLGPDELAAAGVPVDR